jgi:hypothetical protein
MLDVSLSSFQADDGAVDHADEEFLVGGDHAVEHRSGVQREPGNDPGLRRDRTMFSTAIRRASFLRTFPVWAEPETDPGSQC